MNGVLTMKKILTCILCIAIAIPLFSFLAIAGDLNDPWALEDYGQIHYYIPEAAAIPPVADGVITEGEYALALDPMLVDDIEEYFDDRYFFIDAHDDTEYLKLYFAYDENNIYVALELKDHYLHPDEEAYVDMGCGPEMEKMIRARMLPNSEGDAPYYVTRDGSNTDIEDLYFTGYNAGYDDENDILIYEIAYSREELGKYFGVSDYDKVHIRVIPVMFNEEGYQGEVWFGFRNSDIESHYMTWFYRYPHVLHLGPAPVEETETETEPEPAVTEPVDTTPADTEPVETEPQKVTENEVTEPAEEIPTIGAIEEKGCGASIIATSLAIVMSLGICVIFTKKK